MSEPTAPRARGLSDVWQPIQWALRFVTATALAADAYLHAHLAATYDPVRSVSVSQGTLFRIEAGIAALAAIAVLVSGRIVVALVAGAVAGGGLAAVLAYRYIDLGAIGPLPPMYEPVWYQDKTLSALSQAVALVAVASLLLARRLQRSAAPVGPERVEGLPVS